MNNVKFLKRSPSMRELITDQKDDRKHNGEKIAIIIPTMNHKLLETHFDRLKNQTEKNFDIIVIYGAGCKFIASPDWASVLHIRSDDLGSAGAFYLGELIAVSERYEKIILADDDCLPLSDKLIGNLSNRLDASPMVLPRTRHSVTGEPFIDVIYHYGGVRLQTLLTAGLTYLPFYLGGDDFELMKRIRRHHLEIVMIQDDVLHPQAPPFVIWKWQKLLQYSKGNLIQLFLSSNYLIAIESIFIHLMIGVSMLSIWKPRVAFGYFSSAWKASTIQFSKENTAGDQIAIETTNTHKMASENEIHTMNGVIAIESFYGDACMGQDERNALKIMHTRIVRLFREIQLHFFGKDILFVNQCNIRNLPLIMLARSAYLSYNDKTYIITQNRSKLSIVAGLVLFLMSLTPVGILATALSIIGFIKVWVLGDCCDRYGVK